MNTVCSGFLFMLLCHEYIYFLRNSHGMCPLCIDFNHYAQV